MTKNKHNALYFLPNYQAKTMIFDHITCYKKALEHLQSCVNNCPETYQTEEQNTADKVVWLHYSNLQGWHWYIIEKDVMDEQYQAFGIVDGFETEFGYISIAELRAIQGITLDLNWKPKPLSQIEGLRDFIARFEKCDEE